MQTTSQKAGLHKPDNRLINGSKSDLLLITSVALKYPASKSNLKPVRESDKKRILLPSNELPDKFKLDWIIYALAGMFSLPPLTVRTIIKGFYKRDAVTRKS